MHDSKHNLFHIHELFYRHIDIYRYSMFDLNYIFSPSNLHLDLHEICLVNVYDSNTPVIILITLRFKSSVLFGMHTLLDKSIRALQLPKNLSNLTANG